MIKFITNIQFKKWVAISVLIFSSIFILMASTFKTNIPEIGQSGAFSLDTDQERIMGNVLMQQLTGSDFIHPDPIVNAYLDSLSKRIQHGAPSMDFKLHYFCVDSDVLNAFAFFGGHIAVHSALIMAVESESELAAILAHETAHISQRHLARILTNNKRMMPLTIAEVLGAVAIGIIGGNPEAGMHLATAAMGGHLQNLINYTRMHEQEADRIGMQILSKSGFDPHAMPQIFRRLAAKNQYQTKPPEYLLTHPVFPERIADSTNRAEKLQYTKKPENLFFHLIRARLVASTSENAKRRVKRLETLHRNNSSSNKTPLEYGMALSYAKSRQYKQAQELMKTLQNRHPEEWLFELGLGEIAREKGDFEIALEHYKQLYDKYPHHFGIAMIYAESLLDNKQPEPARSILIKNQKNHPFDAQILQLLARSYGLSNDKVALHQTQAEWHFLRGEHKESFQQFDIALQYAKRNPQLIARISTRKKHLEEIVKEQKKLM